MARRDRGDGGLHYKHHRDCPKDPETGKRPAHTTCGGHWVGRVDLGRGGDGHRNSREVTAKTKAGALAKLKTLRREVEDYGDVPSQTMTLEQWLRTWLEDTVHPTEKPATYRGYRSAALNHIIPTIGAYKLAKLEPRHVREMQKRLRAMPGRDGEHLAESTVLKAHNTLSVALSAAMRETPLRRNVATLVRRPTPAKREESLDLDQVRVLLRHVHPDPLGARVAAALFLGARQGEVLGMEWDRIDLEAGTLDLSWQLQRLGFIHGCAKAPAPGAVWPCGKKKAGACPTRRLDVPAGFEHRQLDGGLCLTRPKSEMSKRLIPLPQPMLGWFLLRKALTIDTGRKPVNDLVFTRPDGRPVDPRQDLKDWNTTLAAAGLPQVQLHAARHTTATLLRESGVAPDVIASIMGHSSVLVTQGYIHTDLRLARAAMDGLGEHLALEA